MSSERDILARLEEPPPYSREAREAAIAEALRRFDRLHGHAVAPPSRPAAWWRASLAAPRVGYLVAAGLAIFIAAPLAWIQISERYGGNRPGLTRTAQEAVRERAMPSAPEAERGEQIASSEPMTIDRSVSPSFSSPRAVPPTVAPAPTAPAARQAIAPDARPAPARHGDWDDCNADDPDRRIKGCTRLIESKAESAGNRAPAYLQRGIAYVRKGEVDRAISDFDESIRLDPRNAAAYFNRSLAYQAKGDVDRAKADRARAVGLDPGFASR